MIASFADREAEKIWMGTFSRKLPVEIQRVARRKLIQLDGAIDINDLRIQPGNKLHLLGGNRKGQYSISINMKWRICFRWESGNAHDVEITDYH